MNGVKNSFLGIVANDIKNINYITNVYLTKKEFDDLKSKGEIHYDENNKPYKYGSGKKALNIVMIPEKSEV